MRRAPASALVIFHRGYRAQPSGSVPAEIAPFAPSTPLSTSTKNTVESARTARLTSPPLDRRAAGELYTPSRLAVPLACRRIPSGRLRRARLKASARRTADEPQEERRQRHGTAHSGSASAPEASACTCTHAGRVGVLRGSAARRAHALASPRRLCGRHAHATVGDCRETGTTARLHTIQNRASGPLCSGRWPRLPRWRCVTG